MRSPSAYLEPHSVSRRAQDAPRTALRLPAILVAAPQGQPLLLLEERRAAEPERPVRAGGSRRQARGAARPEHLVRRRHRPPRDFCARPRTAVMRPTASRAAARDWQEFKVIEIADEEDAARHARVGEGVRRVVAGDGFYYSALPGARRRAKSVRRATRTTRSTSIASAPRRPTTSSSTRIAANPQRFHIVSHDRGRAVRDPLDLRARQGQGRQRPLRTRPLEGRDDVQAAHRRRSVTTASA